MAKFKSLLQKYLKIMKNNFDVYAENSDALILSFQDKPIPFWKLIIKFAIIDFFYTIYWIARMYFYAIAAVVLTLTEVLVEIFMKKNMDATTLKPIQFTPMQVSEYIYDVMKNSVEELEILPPKDIGNIFPVKENCEQTLGSITYYRYLAKPLKDSTMTANERQKIFNVKLEQFLNARFTPALTHFNELQILYCYNSSSNAYSSGCIHFDVIQVDTERKYNFLEEHLQQRRETEIEQETFDLFDEDF